MILKIGDKEYTPEFTFNSFKYLEDFDVSALEQLEKKPFALISVTRDLLYGAVNYNPKDFVSLEQIDEFLETYCMEESLVELMENLVEVLQESNFFKSLQKKTTKKAKK